MLVAQPCDVHLRPCTAEDADWLSALYAEQRSAELDAWGWPPEQRAFFLRMQFEARQRHYHAAYPQGIFQVVLSGDVLAGCYYTAELAHKIQVIDISLHADYRGRGIGGALLRSTLGTAKVANKGVSLQVETHNPARRLYEQLGFSVVQDDGVYLSMEYPEGGKYA